MPKFWKIARVAMRLASGLRRVATPRSPLPDYRDASPQPAPPLSATMQAIMAERARIHAAFERTASQGYVPADALTLRLQGNHGDALAEERRTLDRLKNSLEGHLRRLDALFPEPSPPEPAPPTPPRARRFGSIGDHWAQPGTGALH